MHTLSAIEIEEFASRPGANRKDVEYFLNAVAQPGTKEGALLSLYYDARLYRWNASTIKAIEAGICLAYAEDGANSEASYNEISTPLPGGAYSLWPYSNR
ncbi:MAG: hypothetical protein HPY61_01990 [Methanotrichaceae archaeon]|nr:hypothetical protein [Methanotrichaceae archaeon]